MSTKISELAQTTNLSADDLLLVSKVNGESFESKGIRNEDLIRGVGRVPATLTYAPVVTTDLSTGNLFKLVLTGDVLLENPSNAVDGRTYMWWIKQDGSTRSITLGDKFVIPSSASTPLAWSSGSSKMDIFTVLYDGTEDKFYVVSLVPGY